MRERNLALKICKNYRKSQSHTRAPNITKLNEELLAYYRQEQKSPAKISDGAGYAMEAQRAESNGLMHPI